MPFNGSGSFTPPGASFPAVANTLIEASKFNAVINDIATGLSTCVTKDGQTTVTANIPFGGFRLTGIGAATARTDAARASQLQDGTLQILGTVAGTDTITAVLTPAITAYVTGQQFVLIPAVTNTASATLNINGVGAKTLKKNSQAGYTTLVANDLIAGNAYIVVYDDAGSDQFVVLNPNNPAVGGLTSNKASGNGSDTGIVSAATTAGYGWSVTGQAADSKNWDIIGTGLTWRARAVNDANNSATNFMQATRTSGTNTVATLDFTATAATFSGTLGVTGAATFTQDIHMSGAPRSTSGGNNVAIGGVKQTTIGANGAASALTANPVGYIQCDVGGVAAVIPYYNR